ncbi:MAG: ABC transporter ATP-binding protein [Bacteroidales bacterium]|nr:ABC transporter ATP-binding protein [Bacteroidales bacterium]HOK98940.1 ABC transporter ATP-binding protein [Bacteroidales bacterium]HPO65119.1 ABC transporter ATP-binding protein [Bacteroidales bacterium]
MSDSVIVVHDLVKKFGDFVANDHLTFSVQKGEIFGFLGANGAGKTTAMRILCGLLTPTSGEAFVNGYDVYTQSEAIKKNIGYMSQKFSLYDDLTTAENIQFYATIYGMNKKQIAEKTESLLNEFGLLSIKNTLVSDIPLGWKQKIAFLIATFHNPSVVFLDEPTGGVDPLTRRQFWELIHQAAALGTTVFVTTHYMDEAEYCDRVSIMSEGKIMALDTPEALKKQYNARSMDEVFYQIARNSYSTNS